MWWENEKTLTHATCIGDSDRFTQFARNVHSENRMMERIRLDNHNPTCEMDGGNACMSTATVKGRMMVVPNDFPFYWRTA